MLGGSWSIWYFQGHHAKGGLISQLGEQSWVLRGSQSQVPHVPNTGHMQPCAHTPPSQRPPALTCTRSRFPSILKASSHTQKGLAEISLANGHLSWETCLGTIYFSQRGEAAAASPAEAAPSISTVSCVSTSG